MKLLEYIDKYGDLAFNEESFNMIDAAIFSYLSYVKFDNIIDNNEMSIESAGSLHYKKNNNKIDKELKAIKESTNLLYSIMKTKRYKDCKIMKYVYDESTQFCALSIEFMPKKIFVSFEGSDGSISGWIENFNLSYSFPTISHKEAIKYLERSYTLSSVELYLGGHSKGGNLAQVSGAFSNFLVEHKIKKIYSFDGPGLLDREYKTKKYQKICNKYIHIIPNSSLIGMLLNNSNELVVLSKSIAPNSHDIFTWEIDNCNFSEAKLDSYSKEFRENIFNFLKKYNEKEREDFVHNLSKIFEKSNIISITDFKGNYKKAISVLKSAKDISNENKKFILDFINVFVKAFQRVATNKAKSIIESIKKSN